MQQAKWSLTDPIPHNGASSGQDKREELSRKSQQLNSLLSILYGGGGESFRCYNDDVQDCVIWLASDLSGDVQRLVQEAI